VAWWLEYLLECLCGRAFSEESRLSFAVWWPQSNRFSNDSRNSKGHRASASPSSVLLEMPYPCNGMRVPCNCPSTWPPLEMGAQRGSCTASKWWTLGLSPVTIPYCPSPSSTTSALFVIQGGCNATSSRKTLLIACPLTITCPSCGFFCTLCLKCSPPGSAF
jgi:hypothetical protein